MSKEGNLFEVFTLRRVYGFYLIQSNAWSDVCLNRRQEMVTIVKC